MTEKEEFEAKKKADELVYYYYNLLEPFIEDKDFLSKKAKQCALICIEEVVSNYISECYTTRFYRQVKQELEKM